MNRELLELNIIEKAKQEQKKKDLEAKRKYQQYVSEEANADIMNMIRNRKARELAISKAPNIIRESLLRTFLNTIYESTLDKIGINDYKGVRFNFIDNYINESGGVSKVMKYFDTASELLSETVYYINEHTKRILEDRSESDDEETIIKIELTDDERKSFLDDINIDTIDQVSEKVASGVQQAQAEFLHYNEQDKAHIEAIISATQEKVNSTIKESLITLYENDCKQAINMVRDRSKSIYEVMVDNICKQAYTNDLIKEQFLTENSQLNLDSILETAQIMYTFLEMTNTIKLEKVDESYIEKVYKELTGTK